MVNDRRPRRRRFHWRRAAAVLAFCVAAAPATVAAEDVIRLAVTTSTRDSGLIDILLPEFERRYRLKTHVIALGTGKALTVARRGDVDALLVHAPEEEEEFVRRGWADSRLYVMYNHFVLLGPPADDAEAPPTVSGLMRRVAADGELFVSRGDSSGTHKKEMRIWESLGVRPAGDWYLSIGQGMASTLRLANQKGAFVLSDYGTFLSLADRLDLRVRARGGDLTHNPYHFLTVNPAKHPHVNRAGAGKLGRFLTGAEGQRLIADFKIGGRRLFYPAAPAPDVDG